MSRQAGRAKPKRVDASSDHIRNEHRVPSTAPDCNECRPGMIDADPESSVTSAPCGDSQRQVPGCWHVRHREQPRQPCQLQAGARRGARRSHQSPDTSNRSGLDAANCDRACSRGGARRHERRTSHPKAVPEPQASSVPVRGWPAQRREFRVSGRRRLRRVRDGGRETSPIPVGSPARWITIDRPEEEQVEGS